MKFKRICCGMLAAALLSGCAMPDFAAYPASGSIRQEATPCTVTVALPEDCDPLIAQALRQLAEQTATLSDGAVTLLLLDAADAADSYFSGETELALLSGSEIAALATGFGFLEFPFVFNPPLTCTAMLSSSGNPFSDNKTLDNALRGEVLAVLPAGNAGLLSVGALPAEETLEGCRIGALSGLPGSEAFSLMGAPEVQALTQEQIFAALEDRTLTQGELRYGGLGDSFPEIATHFYATDHRALHCWLVGHTGEGGIPADVALLIQSAYAYIADSLEQALEMRRTETLDALSALGVEVVELEEFEYYYYTASDIYIEKYTDLGLSDRMLDYVSSMM